MLKAHVPYFESDHVLNIAYNVLTGGPAWKTLTVQTVRHVYLRFFTQTHSVLDKYDQPLKEEITKAQTLEELLGMYDRARNQVKEYEAGKSKEQL